MSHGILLEVVTKPDSDGGKFRDLVATDMDANEGIVFTLSDMDGPSAAHAMGELAEWIDRNTTQVVTMR